MACPVCGELCTCLNPREGPAPAILLEEEPANRSPQPTLDSAEEKWRQEVSSRVDAFCARRGRKRMSRTPSLSLDFERAARATVAAHYAVPEPQPQVSVEPDPEPTNVIEFPRPVPESAPLPFVEELAEPILEKPRILDAEEPSGLLFGGQGRPTITLDSPEVAPQAEEAGPAEGGASLGRRIFVAIVDAVLVVIATAMFTTIFLRITGTLPQSRAAMLMAAAIPMWFWAMYQYLFLVHAGGTPGMRVARLRVHRFDGRPAPRNLRRWRALGMVISALALGMGFLWAAIDEYGLCWHDRITRTFLRRA
jgi:uncharacterized RDD family membrane protein YckC